MSTIPNLQPISCSNISIDYPSSLPEEEPLNEGTNDNVNKEGKASEIRDPRPTLNMQEIFGLRRRLFQQGLINLHNASSYDDLWVGLAGPVAALEIFLKITAKTEKKPIPEEARRAFLDLINFLFKHTLSVTTEKESEFQKYKKIIQEQLKDYPAIEPEVKALNLLIFLIKELDIEDTTLTIGELKQDKKEIGTSNSGLDSLIFIYSMSKDYLIIIDKIFNKTVKKLSEFNTQIDRLKTKTQRNHQSSLATADFLSWQKKTKALIKIYEVRSQILFSSIDQINLALRSKGYLTENEKKHCLSSLKHALEQLKQTVERLGKKNRKFIYYTEYIVPSNNPTDWEHQEAGGVASISQPDISVDFLDKTIVKEGQLDAAESSPTAFYELMDLALSSVSENQARSHEHVQRRNEDRLAFQQYLKEKAPKRNVDEVLRHINRGLTYLKDFDISLQECDKAVNILFSLCISYNQRLFPPEPQRNDNIDLSIFDKHVPSLKTKLKLQQASRLKKTNASTRGKKNKKEIHKEVQQAPIIHFKATKLPSCPKPKMMQPTLLGLFTELHSLIEKNQTEAPAAMCYNNAAYHIAVLGSTIELWRHISLHPLEKSHKQTLLFRLIRNGSLALEQIATAHCKNNLAQPVLQHRILYLMSQTHDMNRMSTPLVQYMSSIDYGMVYGRYPFGSANFLKSINTPLPQDLGYLLNEVDESHLENLMLFPLQCLAALEPSTNKTVSSLLDKIHDKPITQTLPPSQLSERQIKTYLSEIKQIYQRTSQFTFSESWPAHCISNFNDLLYHLKNLEHALMTWKRFPQIIFLASHVDALLIHLALIDELFEENVYYYQNQKELRMHDLQYYRILRSHEESGVHQEALRHLDIAKYAQYPVLGTSEYEKYHKSHSASRNTIPNAISWRLNSAFYSLREGFFDQKSQVNDVLKLEKDLLDLVGYVLFFSTSKLKMLEEPT